jgi:hypothetical protein
MKRLLVLVALVLTIAAVPATAFAATRSSVSISGIKSTYAVAPGAKLVVSGRLFHGLFDNWVRHQARLRLQRYNSKKKTWQTLSLVVPNIWGYFTLSKSAAAAGSYRVTYNGCAHFLPRTVGFKMVSKTDPKLVISLGGAVVFNTPAVGSVKVARPRGYDVKLDGSIVSSVVSFSKLVGGSARITIQGSTDGIRFSNVATLPVMTFKSGERSDFTYTYFVDALPEPTTLSNISNNYYVFFRAVVSWSGNSYTTPGTFTSSAAHVATPQSFSMYFDGDYRQPELTSTSSNAGKFFFHLETYQPASYFPAAGLPMTWTIEGNSAADGSGAWQTINTREENIVPASFFTGIGDEGYFPVDSTEIPGVPGTFYKLVRMRVEYLGSSGYFPTGVISNNFVVTPPTPQDLAPIITTVPISNFDPEDTQRWYGGFSGTITTSVLNGPLDGTLATLHYFYKLEDGTFSEIGTEQRAFSNGVINYRASAYLWMPGFPTSERGKQWKLVVDWPGNYYPNSGSFTSAVQDVSIPEKQDTGLVATISGSSQPYVEFPGQYIVDLSGTITPAVDHWMLQDKTMAYAMQESSDGVHFDDRITGTHVFGAQPFDYNFSAAFDGDSTVRYFRTRMTWPGGDFTNGDTTYSPVLQVSPPAAD